jgi:3',5'-cyclic AMP phosphodiesterase CpdA
MHPDHLYIQFSDTHILPHPDDRLHGVDTMQTLQDAIAAVSDAGLKPEAFILSGDLTDAGALEAYKRLRTVIGSLEDRFGVPVLPVMGNHDAREAFYDGLLGWEASAAPYHYEQTIGTVRFLVLDSTVPGHHHGALGAEQIEWLRGELETTPAPDGTIVVFHHPPIPGPIPLLNSMTLADHEALEAVIAGSDVVGILNGHVHHPLSAIFGDVLCHAAPATAYTVDPLYQANGFRGVTGPGFSVIQLYGRRMIATAVALPASREEVYRYTLTQEQWDAFVGRMAPAALTADAVQAVVEAHAEVAHVR